MSIIRKIEPISGSMTLKLNEQKILSLKRGIENALIDVLKAGKIGEHTITIKVFCGNGGGLSKARIAVNIDSPVEMG